MKKQENTGLHTSSALSWLKLSWQDTAIFDALNLFLHVNVIHFGLENYNAYQNFVNWSWDSLNPMAILIFKWKLSTAILHFSIIPLKISKPWFWVCTLSLKVGIWGIEPSKMNDFWWSELNIFMLIFTFTVWTIAMLTYRMKTQIGIFRRGWKFLSLIWNIKTAISNVSTTPLWILEPQFWVCTCALSHPNKRRGV